MLVLRREHRADRALRRFARHPLGYWTIGRDAGEIERSQRNAGGGQRGVDEAMRRRADDVGTELIVAVGDTHRLEFALVEGKADDHVLGSELGMQETAHVGHLEIG